MYSVGVLKFSRSQSPSTQYNITKTIMKKLYTNLTIRKTSSGTPP